MRSKKRAQRWPLSTTWNSSWATHKCCYRDTITTVEDEDLGPIKMQNVMARLTGTPGTIRFPGRRLGQDNEEL